jgi:hypothetical protein
VRREDLRLLFDRARELCGHADYVVMGSLAVLGQGGEVPARMAASIDVDAYCRDDPARTLDLAPALGQGSPFEAEHGFYLDPITPRVATLPAGWEARLVRQQLGPDLAAWFLEPHDAAVSKYARMEPRDREWIRPGLRAGILSLPILEARFEDTAFLDPAEAHRARRALDEDRLWLRSGDRSPRRAGGTPADATAPRPRRPRTARPRTSTRRRR